MPDKDQTTKDHGYIIIFELDQSIEVENTRELNLIIKVLNALDNDYRIYCK